MFDTDKVYSAKALLAYTSETHSYYGSFEPSLFTEHVLNLPKNQTVFFCDALIGYRFGKIFGTYNITFKILGYTIVQEKFNGYSKEYIAIALLSVENI